MNPSFAAAFARAVRPYREHTTGGPAGFRVVSLAKKEPDDRDERVCKAICSKREDGTTDHRTICRIGIHEFNKFVNTRQVRRNYARIMAERGLE